MHRPQQRGHKRHRQCRPGKTLTQLWQFERPADESKQRQPRQQMHHHIQRVITRQRKTIAGGFLGKLVISRQ